MVWITRKQAAAILGKSEGVINYYVKIGRIRSMRDTRSRSKPVLFSGEDVAALAGVELSPEYLGTRRGTGIIITESVSAARERLLEALITACRESGLDRDEIEGRLSYFYSGLWNETESVLARVR
jgi:hypothetical protein